MNLNELKALVDAAEKLAAVKGIAARDYPVYIIQKSGNISDISTWSPADFNRGGVAFIIR